MFEQTTEYTPEQMLILSVIKRAVKDLVLENRENRISAYEFLMSPGTTKMLLFYGIPVQELKKFSASCLHSEEFRKENRNHILMMKVK